MCPVASYRPWLRPRWVWARGEPSRACLCYTHVLNVTSLLGGTRFPLHGWCPCKAINHFKMIDGLAWTSTNFKQILAWKSTNFLYKKKRLFLYKKHIVFLYKKNIFFLQKKKYRTRRGGPYLEFLWNKPFTYANRKSWKIMKTWIWSVNTMLN